MGKTKSILFVSSGNYGYISPFIMDQAIALRKLGIKVDFFLIKGKGLFGYLKNLNKLKKLLKENKPDIIHAHYGLSALLASLNFNFPVISTLHGSDINNPKNFWYSKIAIKLSAYSIFVSKTMQIKAGNPKLSAVVPCGVDLDVFKPSYKTEARKIMKLDIDKFYILFASSFNNKVKNYPLAMEACSLVKENHGISVELIELKGYERSEVSTLLNAVDLALLTSFSEGSPQFVKEAMACNCPIASTKVGDVEWLIDGVEGCYLTSFDSEDVAKKIILLLEYSEKFNKTQGRERIKELGLDSETIANEINKIYQLVIPI